MILSDGGAGVLKLLYHWHLVQYSPWDELGDDLRVQLCDFYWTTTFWLVKLVASEPESAEALNRFLQTCEEERRKRGESVDF